MKMTTSNSSLVAVCCTFALILMTVCASPMQNTDDDPVENGLTDHADNGDYIPSQLDGVDTNMLRKLIMQLDEEKFMRASRSWPTSEGRGWGLRNIDGRIARQWRADKRQVRFRQCYFNPISCFKK